MHALFLIAALNAAPHAESLLAPATRAALAGQEDRAESARLARLQGGPENAAAILEEILAGERAAFGTVRVTRAQLLLALAFQRSEAGQHARAIEAGDERLAALELYFGRDDWRAVNARWDVVTARLLCKQPPSARERWQKARKQRTTLRRMFGAGLFREALPLAEESLKAMRETVGDDHPDTAEAMNHLAQARLESGDTATAGKLFKEALHKRKALLGEHHPEYGEALYNLAHIYLDKGDAARAMPLFREALALARRVEPGNTNTLITRIDSVGLVCKAAGDVNAAITHLREAVALLDRHPEVMPQVHARTRNILAALLQEKGDHKAAVALTRSALEIARARLGVVHPDFENYLHNHGATLFHAGEHRGALAVAEETLRIRRRQFGERHTRVADALVSLAKCHLALKAPAAARPIAEEALRIDETARGLTVLANIHEAMGDKAKADECRKKSAAMNPKR